MKAKKLLLILFIFLFMFSNIAYADVGPKPSITVFVINHEGRPYYLDLLTKDHGLEFSDFDNHDDYPETYKDLPLYQYNKDGWLATHIRHPLLFGNLRGEYDKATDRMVHRFSYRGVPNTFKVIVQYEDENLMVSNVITPRQFNSNVLLDLETGKLSKIPQVSLGTSYFALLILLTLIIELIIAKLFQITAYKPIIVTNLLTQIALHVVMVVSFFSLKYAPWFALFLLCELLIPIIEYLIYRARIKDISKKRLLSYSILANLASFLVGLTLLR